MEAELQTHVAFHLTGKRAAASLDAVEPRRLRPALFARYRDLAKLRYDYPLVLCGGDAPVQALSGIVDALIAKVAQGADADRATRQLLALEREIRALSSQGTSGTLSALWETASARLGAASDQSIRATLARARAALDVDGDVVDCDGATPARVVTHVFRAAQVRKAKAFAATAGRLIQQLTDLLRADFVRSDAGRSAPNLRAAFGSLHAETFDFDAMSKLVSAAVPSAGMSVARRERISGLVATLAGQRFHPDSSVPNTGWTFEFDRCDAALAAYRERLPQAKALARALAMAELEVAGEYNEARHDAFFDGFGDDGLDPADVALFPDYLVTINARALDGAENGTLTQILSAGLPFKVVVTSDDVLDVGVSGDGHIGFGRLSRPVATMALGMNDVFVLQAPASHLCRVRDAIARGLGYAGPALFRAFSGANPNFGALPPYLVAAAALESRAFPAWCYDPSAGADWASRFDVSANPQPERDWPLTTFAYEDAEHQRVTEEVAFTLVDFAACDARHARHYAVVPRAQWAARTIPAVDCLGGDARPAERVPSVYLVDADGKLAKAIVDDKLMREARRARDIWRSLQELAGIHNSHAERLVARERALAAERDASSTPPADVPSVTAPPAATVAAPGGAEPAPEKSSDDAYIETPRCTTCNECTTINAKMFAYNENQQAYIKDANAGTYAQLVEAAESCQMGIIHPGKPRNPDEPGLDELVKRAVAFH